MWRACSTRSTTTNRVASSAYSTSFPPSVYDQPVFYQSAPVPSSPSSLRRQSAASLLLQSTVLYTSASAPPPPPAFRRSVVSSLLHAAVLLPMRARRRIQHRYLLPLSLPSTHVSFVPRRTATLHYAVEGQHSPTYRGWPSFPPVAARSRVSPWGRRRRLHCGRLSRASCAGFVLWFHVWLYQLRVACSTAVCSFSGRSRGYAALRVRVRSRPQ